MLQRLKYLYPWRKGETSAGSVTWILEGIRHDTSGWCVHQIRNQWYWAIEYDSNRIPDYGEGYISGEEKAKARVEKELLNRGYRVIEPRLITLI